MMRDSDGFTLMEIVVVLAVGGLLTTMALAGFGETRDRLGVRSAQTGFFSLHSHARALAVERGRAMKLTVDPAGGVVTVREGCDGAGGAVVESRDFPATYEVAVVTSDGTVELCMTPRGYASPAHNSFTQEVEIRFLRGGRSRTVVLLPLGQAVEP